MDRLVENPEELVVMVNTEGMPMRFALDDRVERVTEVCHHWQVSEEWWEEDITKEYFTLRTDAGKKYDIYRDMSTDSWYLLRVHN